MSYEYYQNRSAAESDDIQKSRHIADLFVMFDKKVPNSDKMKIILYVLRHVKPREVKMICENIVMNESYAPRPATIRSYVESFKAGKEQAKPEIQAYNVQCETCKDMGLVPVVTRSGGGVFMECTCFYAKKHSKGGLMEYDPRMPVDEDYWDYFFTSIDVLKEQGQTPVTSDLVVEHKNKIKISQDFWRDKIK